MTRVGRKHRSPGTGGLGDGLRRGKKIATAWSEWRFGEPPPGARAPPEAHESLVSRETACGSAIDGLSFPFNKNRALRWAPQLAVLPHEVYDSHEGICAQGC